MLVTIYYNDRIVFRGDLDTEDKCGDTYVRWHWEMLILQNENEARLTGSEPSRRPWPEVNLVGQSPTLPPAILPGEITPSTIRDDLFVGVHCNTNLHNDIYQEATGGDFRWDSSQEEVIRTSKCTRLLVGAGPGTGKTAVACARVAFLIEEEGCNPSDVWLVSFTRTAVAEIRDRIATYLKDPYLSGAVRIATVDSNAWAINSGFDEEATLTGSFEENIEAVIELIKKHEGVFEYIKELQHLIVDEAQDLIGPRATLIIEMINKLKEGTGFTIFSDEAQAIYGFSVANVSQSTVPTERQVILPVRLRNEGKIHREAELNTIHRTSSPGLKEIFSKVRCSVLQPAEHPLSKYHHITEMIRHYADTTTEAKFDPLQLPGDGNTFALFRNKIDVLKASSDLNGRPHRLRMGGIPNGVVPWLGAVLEGLATKRIRRNEFDERWEERNVGVLSNGLDADAAWNNLVRLGGGTPRIDLGILRQKLVRRTLPASLVLPELGSFGPVIGTIHAAKGREADTVYLFIPPNRISLRTDHEEETRVMFVGATRPRKWLHVGRSYENFRGNRKGERIWERIPSAPNARHVMLGLPRDIDPTCLVGNDTFGSKEEAQAAQRTLLELALAVILHGPVHLSAQYNGHHYELKTDEGFKVCALSKRVHSDLVAIGRQGRPDKVIKGIWLMDISTMTVQEGLPLLNSLHSPWNESGIMLYPRIIGFPKIKFR